MVERADQKQDSSSSDSAKAKEEEGQPSTEMKEKLGISSSSSDSVKEKEQEQLRRREMIAEILKTYPLDELEKLIIRQQPPKLAGISTSKEEAEEQPPPAELKNQKPVISDSAAKVAKPKKRPIKRPIMPPQADLDSEAKKAKSDYCIYADTKYNYTDTGIDLPVDKIATKFEMEEPKELLKPFATTAIARYNQKQKANYELVKVMEVKQTRFEQQPRKQGNETILYSHDDDIEGYKYHVTFEAEAKVDDNDDTSETKTKTKIFEAIVCEGFPDEKGRYPPEVVYCREMPYLTYEPMLHFCPEDGSIETSDQQVETTHVPPWVHVLPPIDIPRNHLDVQTQPFGISCHDSYVEDAKKYHAALEASDGFDVPAITTSFSGQISPMLGRPAYLEHYAQSAIDLYNKQRETNYQVVKIEKTMSQSVKGRNYFITFQAKSGVEDATKTFEAKVWEDLPNRERNYKHEVIFCREKGNKQGACLGRPMFPLEATWYPNFI